MTIGAWILVALLLIVLGTIAALLFYAAHDEESAGYAVAGAATLLLAIILCGIFIWYRGNSASGQRALKDQQSDLQGGISRTVTVLDISGKQIAKYSGKFDIETGNSDNASYVLFDDENGKRHIIYYTTGTIIIDEN